jgi:surface carbohydrate biosynthesis protein (TIGR04326 family)
MGAELMRNLLNGALFDTAISVIKKQKQGFYLMENQGWEFGFVHAWKTYSFKDSLIGVAHSTVRYWDLRYHFDARLYDFSSKSEMPLPSLIGVNGPAVKKIYLDSGWDKNHLIELEALRYLHLDYSDSSHNIKSNDNKKNSLLILGDIDKSNTKRQLELLKNALQYIDNDVNYIIKPHPLCPINPDDFHGINCKVTYSPIYELFERCFLAYTSCLTSSSVDAYCYGIPVATCLDLDSLNQSPLRGFKGVLFTNSAQELARYIIKSLDAQKYNKSIQTSNYFYLNNSLEKWKNILKK